MNSQHTRSDVCPAQGHAPCATAAERLCAPVLARSAQSRKTKRSIVIFSRAAGWQRGGNARAFAVLPRGGR
jgi:hypothetical protein